MKGVGFACSCYEKAELPLLFTNFIVIIAFAVESLAALFSSLKSFFFFIWSVYVCADALLASTSSFVCS